MLYIYIYMEIHVHPSLTMLWVGLRIGPGGIKTSRLALLVYGYVGLCDHPNTLILVYGYGGL